MTLIHDIIKIKYVSLGYIKKNYPYHLISDEEMFNAFIDVGTGFTSSLIDPNVRFFDSYYPNPFVDVDIEYKGVSLSEVYANLKSAIVNTVATYLDYKSKYGDDVAADYMPDWIYTYMLGEVVYQQSDYLDIHDTLVLLKCVNNGNEFTPEACLACYITSLGYVSTLDTSTRPPTVFGEPHVIKQLRLET